uniref:C2H2-type domain-containing protein n=1 Tax=Hucho hucho TaxID=62062 RepID=A0A4W5NG16_9TELE
MWPVYFRKAPFGYSLAIVELVRLPHNIVIYSTHVPATTSSLLVSVFVDEVTVKVEDDTPLTWNADKTHLGEGHSQGNTSDFLDYRESLETNLNVATHSPLHAFRDLEPLSTSMGPSDSHGRVFFDQILNSNDRARAQAQGGGATSGNSKEKRFLCMFCNKGFSCTQNVAIHQRVHTGEKPFSCTQCHMRFAQAGTLKRHQRVHTGVKPFSCTQCHMRFAQAGDLKRHQRRIHTGEKPFSCTQCHMRFAKTGDLKRHQRVHTGEKPFGCHLCRASFSHSSSLKRVFLYFYYFLHCRIIVKTSKL